MPEEKIIEKSIQVASLTQRTVNYTDKKDGKAKSFVVYQVFGNDGIKYETPDENWYRDRKVGEQIDIKYTISTSEGQGGQIYTNYRLVVVRRTVYQAIDEVKETILEAVRKTYKRLDEVEKNLLARMDLMGDANIVSPEDTKEEVVEPPAVEETEEELPEKEEDPESPEIPF